MNSFFNKVKKTLENYKIFMEFFSMICISIMGIMVSISANRLSEYQIELSEKQIKAEVAPKFEMIDSEFDSRPALWLRNYQKNKLRYIGYNISINPFHDFSEALLTDKDFYDTYCNYDDWEIVNEYLNSNKNAILDNATQIKYDFNRLINQPCNTCTFENTGGEISNVIIQPFVICEIYNHPEVKLNSNNIAECYFIINDFMGISPTIEYKNNNTFSLNYMEVSILYEGIDNLKEYLDAQGRECYIHTKISIRISYCDAIEESRTDLYQLDTWGTGLIKIQPPNIKSIFITPDPDLSKTQLNDIEDITKFSFQMNDLFNKSSNLYKYSYKYFHKNDIY